MKLRDFIAEALVEIQQGVTAAIDRRDKEGLLGRISPIFRESDKSLLDWTKLIEKVEFDVAVTESDAKEVSGEGGLDIVPFAKLGGKGAVKREQTSVNRIKFSVPVLYPSQITHSTS